MICLAFAIAAKHSSPIWQMEATETMAISDNTNAQNANGPGCSIHGVF